MLIAIDPSSKYMTLVWFSRAGGWIDYTAVGEKVKAQYAEQRINGVFDALKDELAARKEEAEVSGDTVQVWCEAVVYAGQQAALAQMSACITAVQLACHELSIPYYTINQSTWKKEIIGSGRADKAQIKEFLVTQKFLPDDLTPADVYDAYAIGLAALRRLAEAPAEAAAPAKRPNRRPPK